MAVAVEGEMSIRWPYVAYCSHDVHPVAFVEHITGIEEEESPFLIVHVVVPEGAGRVESSLYARLEAFA